MCLLPLLKSFSTFYNPLSYIHLILKRHLLMDDSSGKAHQKQHEKGVQPGVNAVCKTFQIKENTSAPKMKYVTIFLSVIPPVEASVDILKNINQITMLRKLYCFYEILYVIQVTKFYRCRKN